MFPSFLQLLENTSMVALHTLAKSPPTFYSGNSKARTKIDFSCVPQWLAAEGKYSKVVSMVEEARVLQIVKVRRLVDHVPVGARIFLKMDYDGKAAARAAGWDYDKLRAIIVGRVDRVDFFKDMDGGHGHDCG